MVDSHEKVSMCIAIPANEEGTNFHIVQSLNTLLVPGSHSHSVSTLALNMSGTLANFDTTHACLTINGKDIEMNNPCHQRTQSQGLPFAHNLESLLPAKSPTDKDESKTKSLLK